MVAEKGNKPLFEDKEGNIKLAIFKNKNSNNKVYPVMCFTFMRFPFKYNQKIYITPSEVKKLTELIERIPEIKVGKE